MRDRLYLDMMQQIMSSTTKVVVDQKGGNNLLYLPLDKLIQQSNPGASAVAPAASAAPQAAEQAAPAPAGAGKGGRDVTRGRDFWGGAISNG